MPLARILTLNPEQVDDFAQQLYDLGFEVDVVSPHEEATGPADLEVEFAICDQQQVLARAAAIAAQLQSEVVVFPGAIPPVPKSLSLGLEAADESADSSQNRLSESPIPMEEAQRILDSPMQPPPHVSQLEEFSGQPSASDPGESIAQKPALDIARAFKQFAERFNGHLRELNKTVAQAMASVYSSLTQVLVRIRTSLSSATQTALRRASSVQESLKLRISQAREARERRVAQRKEQQAEEARNAAAQEQERQRQYTFTTQRREQELERMVAERETLLAEIERLRSHAREQSAALEQARLMAAPEQARLMAAPEQARQQAGSQPQEQFLQGSEHEGALHSGPQKPAKAVRQRIGQLRGALAGALTASFLFLLGLLWANFHGITPLSGNLNNGTVEEQVPFGPTTVHGKPGATVGASQSRSSPATRFASPQAQPEPVKNNPGTAKPSPEWHHFRRSSNSNGDDGTDDVVVRHFGPPKETVTQVEQRAGIKRYSDE